MPKFAHSAHMIHLMCGPRTNLHLCWLELSINLLANSGYCSVQLIESNSLWSMVELQISL